MDAAACAARLHALGVPEVVVKLGADGAYVSTSDGVIAVPAATVGRVVDTTGAGDAFGATYLAMRLHGAAPAPAAGEAARVAAAVVERPGGIVDVPEAALR
jgi:2-dehydro-3-deoxygluconokinase